MNLTGVILAGGASSRMGTDKGLFEFNGKPLIQYSIDLLSMFCDAIIISSNNSEYKKFGCKIVSDSIQNIGPIGGLYSVMKTVKSDYYFFISCDTPYADQQLAGQLIKGVEGYDIVVPMHSGDKIEPLFGIYSEKVFPIIEGQISVKNYKLMDLFDPSKTNIYHVSGSYLRDNPNIFKNINSPNDVR